MAATGKTPILLYGSTTATNAPVAGNLTNSSDGCEIAINVADKNLFFKDSTNTVNTVPIRQSSASSNGWLSSTDWNTFNSKQPAGTYVTSVTGTAPVVSSGGTTPAISMAAATSSVDGYLTSTDWTTFNNKSPAAGSSSITTVGTITSGTWNGSTIDVARGGTGATTFTAGRILFGNSTSAINTSANLFWDNANSRLGLGSASPNTRLMVVGSGSSVELFHDVCSIRFASSPNRTNSWYMGGNISDGVDGGFYIGQGANITTGTPRLEIDFAGNAKVNSGNLVIGTSGKGIDFSATAGTGTSELLADYEEGTWTPVLNNFVGTASVVSGTYTKIGRLVYIYAIIVPTTTIATTVASSYVSGLPYNPAVDGHIVNWATAYTGQLPSIIVSAHPYAPTIAATSAAFYLTATYTV